MKTIGERIRTARQERRPKCSQTMLAGELSLARWNQRGLCDRQQVYRWETGRRIPVEWLPYLEQVLGIDLSADTEPHVSDTVAAVVRLGGADVDRRQFFAASAAVSLAALGPPDAEAVTRRVSRPGPVAVGMGEVTAVRTMTTTLGNAASELGGGHARHLAVRYLILDVRRWLDGRFTEQVGRELFAAASELVQLIGWKPASRQAASWTTPRPSPTTATRMPAPPPRTVTAPLPRKC